MTVSRISGMAFLQPRGATTPGLQPTLVVAISTGFGVVLLSLIITLVCLLIRSIRKHKRLLADLEHRGVILAQQSASSAKEPVITKPRAVLKKHRILPFNLKTGWGALPSVETVHDVGRTSVVAPADSTTVPHYYAPPKPPGFVEKPKRLSWPFSARRPSGRAMRMRKIRAPPLSTVIESPKPSPLVPVLSAPGENGSTTSPRNIHVRSTSDQSLLQRHPVFRGDGALSLQLQNDALRTGAREEPLRRSMTARPVTKPEIVNRTNRSNSIADIPVSEKGGSGQQRPQLHARSASLCSQASGNAPEGGLPPLPLQIALVKGGDARRRSLLSHSPSRMSNSSFESADTTILNQSSPLARSAPLHGGIRKVTKRDPRNSSGGVVTPRAVRNNTVVVHRKHHTLQNSIKGSITRLSSVTSSSSTQQDQPIDFRHSLCSTSPSSQNLERASSFMSRSVRTPKRRSVTLVTPYGSPEDRRKRSSVLQGASGNQGIPARQLSQTSTQASSTRSSNGNPFQWDSAPMSAGKPSNLKGSPLARKGHRRQNCVRLVIEPTVLGGRSRSSSPAALMKDVIHEESPPSTARNQAKADVGLGFTNRRSLPQPPSTATFAPDLKLAATATRTTSIRASLTPSSPTLSVVNYDHGPIGSPVLTYKPTTSPGPSRNNNRGSTGSQFYIPTFPNPYERGAEIPDFANAPPTFALSRSPALNDDDGNGNDVADIDTGPGASSPFEILVDIEPSPTCSPPVEEYDPEHPQLVLKTHSSSSSPKPRRNFSSPFSAILEETPSPLTTTKPSPRAVHPDSPPCSPKTIPSSTFDEPQQEQQREEQGRCAFDLPIHQTAILEESEVIDPALLSNEAFHSLHEPTTSFEHSKSSSSMATSTPLPHFSFPAMRGGSSSDNTSTSTSLPTTLDSAHALMQPLIDAAFSSSPPPPSPRPKHAQLPPSPPTTTIHQTPSFSAATPALNFATMPTLAPAGGGLTGPRGLPPRPLRSSILELRRMNSDAERGGEQRAVRRYRRLGREDSIGLPGEESFMDGLLDEENAWEDDAGGKGDVEDEDEEGESTWNEEKERRLVGDLLCEDWEEEDVVVVPPTSSPPPSLPEADKHEKRDEETHVTITSSPSKPPSPSPRPRTPDRSSSIWEDGEKFWTSTPPFPPKSSPCPTIDKPRLPPPCSSSPTATSSPTTTAKRSSCTRSRYRTPAGKRNTPLGVMPTPNVRIQVFPPVEAAEREEGTPGSSWSLYDGEGFLRR